MTAEQARRADRIALAVVNTLSLGGFVLVLVGFVALIKHIGG